MEIRIKNLRLRTYIGIESWEQEKPQDIVINIRVRFDGDAAALSDHIEGTVNYKKMTKQVIHLVEGNRFGLLENLANQIADIAMTEALVDSCEVEVDKPHALRFSDSVSITVQKQRT